MSDFNPPPGPPFNPNGPVSPTDLGPDLGVGNPYASITPIELSSATFDQVASIDPERLAIVMAEVTELTNSNLTEAAKCRNYLRILDSALRSVGYVARIAAIV